MSADSNNVESLVQEALKDDNALNSLIDELLGSSRRDRQNAAGVLVATAKKDPNRLRNHINSFVEALNLPEARTRWEVLDVLSLMVAVDAASCDDAIEGAEASLFDEESGPVRLSAMRFLCKLGATSQERSNKVWPLIDEGIQCYHGDLEFNDMLQSLVEFSLGSLSDDVKKQLKERMSFDAQHGKGSIKHYSETIIGNLK